jgi:hypothetical protein
MAKFYDVNDWYWIVASVSGKVFSSKIGDYVLLSDPTYLDFISDGTTPTAIDNESNLGIVLSEASIRPVAATVLNGFLDNEVENVIIRRIFKIVFNHENRLRAVERSLGLNGSPANLTVAQAKAVIRNLL